MSLKTFYKSLLLFFLLGNSVLAQDLIISSFQLTNKNVSAGNNIYPTVAVSNSGSASAGSNYTGYYLSVDSILSVNDTYLASVYISSLSAGTSTNVSPSVALPTSLSNGTYYLFAYADYSGSVSETNENNNSKFVTLNVVPSFVDLTISLFTATSTSLTAGSYFYPTVYEKNAGNALAGYNYIGYYLSTDSTYSVGDTYLTSTYSSSLGGGESYAYNPSITVPSGTLQGQYYIVAVADYSSYVSESNENNNSKALKITVAPVNIDLLISSFSSTNTKITAGTYFYPSVYEYNAGNASADYNYIGYYLSTDSIYSVGDTYLTSTYSYSLSAGGSYSYSPSITVPTSTLQGQYYVIAVADYSNYVSETNENNNSKALKITVVPINIDLRITYLSSLSTSITAGSYFSPTVYLNNAGTSLAGANYIGYYLSTDSTYSVGDTYLTSTYAYSLGSGESYSYNPTISIPAGTLQGQYYIVAAADYDNSILETNENNNTKALKITVMPVNIDLRISSISTTNTNVTAGAYIYPIVYIKNAGSTISGYNYIGYYFSTDSTYSVGDTYLTSTYTYSLAGGESYAYSPSISLPSGTLQGQYYIIAVADYSNYVSETNENNNTKALKITVAPASIDLRISQFSSTNTNLSTGTYFYPTVYQNNTGNTASGYSYIGYYLSADSTYSIGDTYLTSTYTYSLAGGESYSYSPSISLPTGTLQGQYYIIAVADYSSYVIETNENNNTRALKITVAPASIDLRISQFSSTNTSLSTGSYFYPTVYQNNSGNTASGYSYIGYYLSADSIYSVGDTYLTSTYASSLAGGESYSYSPSISLPTGTLQGQYYIIAVADYSSYVIETNENNNTRALKITVAPASIDLSISQFTSTTTNLSAGSYFYPTVYQKNTGNSTSGYSYIGYYLSADSTYSIGDTYITSTYTSSLAGGESYSYSPSLYVPSGALQGQYYIIAVADYSSYVSETNENNNTRALKVSITPASIDLRISSFTSTSTNLSSGSYIYPTVYQNNTGNTSSGYSYIGYYLSADSTYSVGDTYLTSTYTSSLSGGESYAYSPSISLPTGTLQGQYYIIAVADYSSYVIETNENNNTRALKITVAPASIDLRISQFTSTTTNLSVGSYFYPLVYQNNTGNTTSGYSYIGYYLSADSIYSVGDSYLTSTYSYSLAGGESYSYSPSLSLPTGTLQGQYYVIAVADYSNYITETNENNNTRALKITVASASIDLKPTYINTISNYISTGGYIYVSANQANLGNSYSGSNYMGFYLSTDSIYNSGDVYLGDAGFYSISGGTDSASTSLYIPTSIVNGNYYILAYSDYQNYINESNEKNNVKSLAIKVSSPVVDLKITEFSNKKTVVTAGSYWFPTLTESNVGSVLTPNSNYVGYYLSTDSIYSSGDVFLLSTYMGTLSGGTSLKDYPSVFIPLATKNGSYYILAVADYTGNVAEINENNNTKAIAITVDFPLGIETIEDLTSLLVPSVYPNPTNGLITLSNLGDNEEIEISDIRSNVVYSSSITDNIKVSINLDFLNQGIYFVKTKKSGFFTHSEKIIIQK